MVAVKDLECDQMDVITAFLHGLIWDRKIYVQQPHGFGEGTDVCELQKALYGLRQSPLLWYERLAEFLTKIGLSPLMDDPCVFRPKDPDTFLVLYVDDLLIIAPTTMILSNLKKKLTEEFDMKDLGPISYYLGIRVVRDRKARKISLVQDAYINKILWD